MAEEPKDLRIAFDRTDEHSGPPIDTAGMMLRVKNRLRRYEGWIPHIYRDTEGHITVGVGFLLDKKSEVGFYSWRFKASKRSAPLVSAQTDWFEVSKLFYGPSRTASFYDAYTYVELSDATIGFALAKKLVKLRDDLSDDFSDAGIAFDELPAGVQEAMFDLGWNLGAGFITGEWPKLRAALKARDWETAATESHRAPPVAETRNTEIRKLIESADRE